MNQHVITKKYKSEGGEITISNQTISGDLSQNVEPTIPAGTVDAEINISIPIATLLSCGFGCTLKSGQAPGASTGAGPLTIKTNNVGTPGDTLLVSVSNGIMWANGDDPTVNPKPLNADVTKLYVSNPGDRDASLSIRALSDSTPVLTG